MSVNVQSVVKKDEILLSIIMPTYNRLEILKLSLVPLLNEITLLLKNSVELIIVDDFSVDNTVEFLDHLTEKFPALTVVKLEKNCGPGRARNAGMQLARGNYIWFIDDDDEIDFKNLKEELDYIKRETQSLNSEIICHSLINSYDKYDEKQQLVKNILLYREKQEVFNYIFKSQLLRNHAIVFSEGLHEDIRFVFEALVQSDRILIVKRQLYKKNIVDGSITSKMSVQRIEGYFNALEEIYKLLEEDTNIANYINGIEINNINESIFIQTLGVVLRLIISSSSKNEQLILIEKLSDLIAKNKLISKYNINHDRMSSNFEYAASEYLKMVEAKAPRAEIISAISDIYNSRISCRDLEHSIFLGPDEIRGCCKRFFKDGVQKGDIVLMPASEDIDINQINNAKEDLIRSINRGDTTECDGCPYLDRFIVQKDQKKVSYISLENFTYCNMRCIYCSPTYYGGQEAKYDANKIITGLIDSGALADRCHIVWGGGEPTLSRLFSPITKVLLEQKSVGMIRVLSNSLRYSENLENFLHDPRISMVTSIDAGDEPTFSEIRGKAGLDQVFLNLYNYSLATNDFKRMTIKYIFTEANYMRNQIEGFIDHVVKYGLINCFFHISLDFRLEEPSEDIKLAFYYMSAKLFKVGAQRIFFDDLIRDRLSVSETLSLMIHKMLDDNDLTDERILSSNSDRYVILWGGGLQSNWITNQTSFGRKGNIIKIVNGDNAIDMLKSIDLEDNNTWIIPCAVQSIYEIEKETTKLGFSDRIKYCIFS